MRIGCLQFAPQVGDVNNNLNRADAVLNKANPEDLDLLVLPEMAFSGYNFKSLRDISPFLEPSGSGISSLWARTTALKYNCTVLVGYPEKVDVAQKWPTSPEYYNSAIVVNEEGETVANYRKTHLYYTDETWALESPKGFYRGFIPGLGNTALGICMDINPYRFQTPWDTFEFAYHILHSEANLVIISMAWLTQQNAGEFSRMPQEPDMETLTYWATRLEPVIRAEDEDDEIIVVFCNRTGFEDEAVYAGTSAVIGIKGGEVSVYGLLGRGDKDLLIVDTTEAPFAKLVLCPTEDPVPAKAAETVGSHEQISSASDEVAAESNFTSPIEDSPESYYKHQDSKSSSSADSEEVKAVRKVKPLPPKLHVPQKPSKTWRRNDGDEVFEELIVPDLPTPSGPSPTPSSGRPKLGLPISKWAAGQAQHIATSPESGSSPKLSSRLHDPNAMISPTDLSDGHHSSRNKRPRRPTPAPTPIDEQPQMTNFYGNEHRRTRSRGSEVSRTSKNRVAFDLSVGKPEPEIRSTSFTRSRHSNRTTRFQDSPRTQPPDVATMSDWLGALPPYSNDQGDRNVSTEDTRFQSQEVIEQVVENRLSTASRDSIMIAASPSVLQTIFHQPLDDIVMSNETVDEDTIAIFASISPHEKSANGSNASSPGVGQSRPGNELEVMNTSPLKIEIPDVIEAKSRERPISVILSPIAMDISQQASPALEQPVLKVSGENEEIGPATNGIFQLLAEQSRNAAPSTQSVHEQAVEDYIEDQRLSSNSGRSPGEGRQLDLNDIKRVSPQCPVHGLRGNPSGRNPNHLSSVVPSREMSKLITDGPNPSPASFTSSVETLSPSNEVPETPLDMEGPSTPKAMLFDVDDAELSTPPLSPSGQIQLQGRGWMGKPPASPMAMNRPNSVMW